MKRGSSWRRRGRRALWLAWLPLLGASCGESPTAPEAHVYLVEVTGEQFRISLVHDDQVQVAEALLASGVQTIVYGELAHGDGGFNAPYRWHMRPGTVSFPDLTIEVCSGRPQSDVESDLPYWIDQLGTFCPWGARIVGRNGR